MSFDKRWLIEGQLTTITPLRIGNGGVTTHPDVKERDKQGKKTDKYVDISALTTVSKGQEKRLPYIPGSSIKGVLRAWAKTCGIENFDNIFGSEDTKSHNAVGGKAEFWDAVALGAYDRKQPPPYWREARLTGVATSVSINRRTRTASTKRLFHREFVPPGVSFKLTVSGDLKDQEVDDLLLVLEGFNHSKQPITLGADGGNGWGQVRWKLSKIKRLQAAEVAGWISSGGAGVGYAALKPISATELEAFKERSKTRVMTAAPTLRACVTLTVKLKFEGHFLVNDPDQTGPIEEKKPSHAPILSADGKILLPASSIRGAVRSQAERILRTLGNEQTACCPDNGGLRPSCEAVYSVEKLKNLCMACQVFGAPGWRAPVQFSDFMSEYPIDKETLMPQEFIAIDRFTGGGAESLKFNAVAAYRPTLIGCITVDLAAIELAGVTRWGIALFALTLRDLMEGDVRLGFGAAKGYGAVRTETESFELPDWNDCPDTLRKEINVEQWEKLKASSPSREALQDVIGYWLMELEERAKTEGAK